MLTSFTKVSGNAKTGPIPTTITEQSSCPTVCPYKAEKMCYPYFSPLGFMWEALNTKGYYGNRKVRCSTPITWEELCHQISRLPKGQLWRHNTAGDLPGIGNAIDTKMFHDLVIANKKARAVGFTYTHKPVGLKGQALINARAIQAANKNGFRVNLSADSLDQADKFIDLNIAPVVVVVPSDAPRKMVTPKGRIVIGCPAEVSDIQCARCGLCAKDRKAIIAFHAHGTKKNAVNSLLKGNRLKVI
jgi:hypothetical protein